MLKFNGHKVVDIKYLPPHVRDSAEWRDRTAPVDLFHYEKDDIELEGVFDSVDGVFYITKFFYDKNRSGK